MPFGQSYPRQQDRETIYNVKHPKVDIFGIM